MSGLCRVGVHKPQPSQVWNAGFYFTQCARCDRDMIRTSEGRWRTVPRGTKVVWRPADEHREARVVPISSGRESLPNLMKDMGLFAFADRAGISADHNGGRQTQLG